ncbi:MAG: C-GCAxxG-C-C family protein [Eubacteriales bacterium]|nr:C-GCAxxG-C-C family protein [Eubacteriales bacterium]
MANQKMTAAQALKLYGQGYHCSQVVFGHAAEDLGMDINEAYRVSAGFGGGLFRGNVCGCVAGAIMALGLAYGHDEPNQTEVSAELTAKVLEFQRRFEEANGSVLCKDLLGIDISLPGGVEEAKASGKMQTLCPRLAESACEILDEML